MVVACALVAVLVVWPDRGAGAGSLSLDALGFVVVAVAAAVFGKLLGVVLAHGQARRVRAKLDSVHAVTPDSTARRPV